jgi:hypothetical protein
MATDDRPHTGILSQSASPVVTCGVGVVETAREFDDLFAKVEAEARARVAEGGVFERRLAAVPVADAGGGQ